MWPRASCCLGALMVATAKRYSELAMLEVGAAGHRPVLRWYNGTILRVSQRVVASAMMVAYLLWAWGEPDLWMRGWHLASAVALALALVRFDRLTAQAAGKPVEDLIARDPAMVYCELAWLTMFIAGL